jgi:hypothetical protein
MLDFICNVYGGFSKCCVGPARTVKGNCGVFYLKGLIFDKFTNWQM